MRRRGHELHQIGSLGWLRASVLGANDGIVSTSSLILGVAAAHAAHASILLTGVAGLVAGAMSMATGEYVSVHSQADTEAAALAQEREELTVDYAGESRELTDIYVHRGLELPLAKQVAEQLMEHDALAAHARDELGLSDMTAARPLQAAADPHYLIGCTVAASLICLLFLGGVSAKVGGADVMTGALRVTLWSALAM